MTNAIHKENGKVATMCCLMAMLSLIMGNVLAQTRTDEKAFRLYNIVPMYIGHEAEQAARCVEMYERTGEDLVLGRARAALDAVDPRIPGGVCLANAWSCFGDRAAKLVCSFIFAARRSNLAPKPKLNFQTAAWEVDMSSCGNGSRISTFVI